MTSAAYDRLAGGFYNPGLKSSGNLGGLSGPGAVRENWQSMLADVATVTAEGSMSALAAAQAAAAAFSAPSSKSTSITEIVMPAIGDTVAVGVVEADRLYAQGQTAVVSVTGDAVKQFSGPILSWDVLTKTLQIKIQFVAGAGTFNAWTVALTAPVDATLSGRVAALEIANARLRTKALFTAKEFV